MRVLVYLDARNYRRNIGTSIFFQRLRKARVVNVTDFDDVRITKSESCLCNWLADSNPRDVFVVGEKGAEYLWFFRGYAREWHIPFHEVVF